MVENWRPIAGYEGLYEVSDQGRVRSIARRVLMKSGRYKNIKQRILRPALSRKNYLGVSLWANNTGRTREIHRLVALAFVPNPNSLQDVGHIDHSTTNNRASNLIWCSHAENMRHSISSGRTRAANNPLRARKLNSKIVTEIREARIRGESYVRIGRRYAIARETARQICLGQLWKPAPARHRTADA